MSGVGTDDGIREWEGAENPPGEVENPNHIRVGSNHYIFYDCWYGSPDSIGVTVVPVLR